MRDFLKIIVLPCILGGIVWAAMWGLPIWTGPLALFAGVGLWASIDWMRGTL